MIGTKIETRNFIENRGVEEEREKLKKKNSKPQKKSNQNRRKKSKGKTDQFRIYIYKILKKVHPDIGISKKAMNIMNSFALDMFDRLAMTATDVTRKNKKITMTSKEMQLATKLELPGELARHAVSEGTKATTKYQQK